MKYFNYIFTAVLLSSYSFAMETQDDDLKQKTLKASFHLDRALDTIERSKKTEISFEDLDIERDLQILNNIILQNILYSIDLGGKEIIFEDFQKLNPVATFVYSLNLCETFLDNECMSFIPSFTNLRKLEISRNLFDDDGMKYLSSLKNLTELRLVYNKVTAKGIENLLSLPNLEELDAGCTYLGNEGIKFVSQIKSLKILNVRACGLDDKALPYLNSMENLQRLDISSNSKLTKGALLKFIEDNNHRKLEIVT